MPRGPGNSAGQNAAGLCLAAALAALPLAAPAQDDPLSAREFCVQAESSVAARRTCEAEHTRALHLFLEYGQAEGYIDGKGGFSFSRVFSDVWSWRTFVGLPPKSPFLTCADKASASAPAYDFRAIWACIAARDPKAARMDAI